MTIIFPKITRVLSSALLITLLAGCESVEVLNPASTYIKEGDNSFQTENVVVVVIDGPRFSETWGDPDKEFIPKLAKELAPQGTVYTNFYNQGPTFTTSGHVAVTTGRYQLMPNDGSALPHFPSIFQFYLNQTGQGPESAQIISSKAKLGILADCTNNKWRGKYNPITDTQDRPDHKTFNAALQVLKNDHPNLLLIHFRGPDAAGHGNDWQGYLNSISETDHYVWELWNFLQAEVYYRNHTTLLVTNDHGRHLDHIKDGFISHGDRCQGCLHINLFAVGPDFKTGQLIHHPRQSVDIAPTIAQLLGFSIPQSHGNVLVELFKTGYEAI